MDKIMLNIGKIPNNERPASHHLTKWLDNNLCATRYKNHFSHEATKIHSPSDWPTMKLCQQHAKLTSIAMITTTLTPGIFTTRGTIGRNNNNNNKIMIATFLTFDFNLWEPLLSGV